MNIKRIFKKKFEIHPDREFDKKFWVRFDDEFEKEERKIFSWGWGVALISVMAMIVFMFVVPQFEDNIESKITAHQIDLIVDEMIQMNSYLTSNLDVDTSFDYYNVPE